MPRCCPGRSPARDAFENAIALDVAMGGSTNTILRLLAAAREAGVDRPEGDRAALAPRALPVQGRAKQLLPPGGRAPGRRHSVDPRRVDRAGLLNRGVRTVHSSRWPSSWPPGTWVRRRSATRPSSCTTAHPAGSAPPGPTRSRRAGTRWTPTGRPAASGRRARVHRDGGLAVLYGNLWRRTARSSRPPECPRRSGSSPGRPWCSRARRTRSPASGRRGEGRRRSGHPLQGPAGRPRHAGNAVPDQLPQGQGARAGPAP